mmetsp:Transcript_36081/g.84582  ORF Transcript_36081/g.84582 Transcript_36081/m.84582 type:complete len:172 (+) Transcript_36081:104-619(+)|eukprot:CAMPEP_0178406486 /NCGR_PEP_ID=MMETSP0689_2-20121128/18936_1 /TAXON_ID=160604 /ORGANISM="Amphidinium massartii, Strain CS-259" /LENGTH=171 /DNA_ID=CAMNT_0020027527 /DNA_START=55 /DNA_END=570 /DNA_ORIENTATION=+
MPRASFRQLAFTAACCLALSGSEALEAEESHSSRGLRVRLNSRQAPIFPPLRPVSERAREDFIHDNQPVSYYFNGDRSSNEVEAINLQRATAAAAAVTEARQDLQQSLDSAQQTLEARKQAVADAQHQLAETQEQLASEATRAQQTVNQASHTLHVAEARLDAALHAPTAS